MTNATLTDRLGNIYNLIGMVRESGPELLIGRNFGNHIPTPADHKRVSQVHAKLFYTPYFGFALQNNSDSGVGIDGERADGSKFYLKKGEVLILRNGDKFALSDSDSFTYMAKSA